MKYKIAIFDMDGTILNTIDDLADAMNYCLKCFDMPVRTVDEVRMFVGNGIHKLVERAVPEGTSDETLEEVFKLFNEYYKDHCAIKTRPYDGICEVIEALRKMGMKTAVVSNKADYAVKSLCRDYFPGLFDYSVGDREGQRRKPCPDSVNAVLDYFKLDKSEAVYLGDSDVDLETARNAGMDVIMVGWGFRDEAFLRAAGADTIIHHPTRILEIVS
ncbi:MAG: HAD family hydrolase [Lachnospiraceae bacterium]|jgi:phosphoglycolate phosphatase